MKNILKLNNLNYRFINRDPNMQIKELHYHSIKRFSEFLGFNTRRICISVNFPKIAKVPRNHMIYCFDLSFSWKSYHFVDLFPQKRKTFPRRILCILVWSSISGSAKNSTSNDTRHTWAYLKLIYNNGPILWGLSPDLELWFAGYGPATMSSRSYSIFSYFIYYFKKKERKLLINEINEIRCRWIFELKCYVVQFNF